MSRGAFVIVVAMASIAAIASTGCSSFEAEQRARHPTDPTFEHPRRPTVQLARARLPQPLTFLAVHYWFNAYDAKSLRWERWELWQERGRVTTSWGHIHLDLMGPMGNVGGGDAVIEAEWTGDEAERLLAVLHRPELYPERDTYRAWPGPNSNTYVAWVLREAGVPFDLSPLAIGKDWRGWVGGGSTTTMSGVHLDSPLVGLKLGLVEGVELHVLAFTFGFAFIRPTLKTPLGSISMPTIP